MTCEYLGIGGYSSPRDGLRIRLGPTPTAVEIQQLLTESVDRLLAVKRAFAPRSRIQVLEAMLASPFVSSDLYVELKWQLARERLREDLQRIIERNRFEMAVERYAINVDLAVDLATAASDFTAVGRFSPIRVDRSGKRL